MLWSFNRWGFPWFPSADFAGQTTAEPLWRCEGSYEPRKGGHFHGGWPWADVLVLKLSVSGNIYMKTWFFNTGVSCRCSLHLILGFFDMLCLCYPLAMKIGRNGELLFAHFPRVFSQPQPALPWDLLPSAMLITGLRNAVATGCAVACPPVVPRVATTTKRTLRRTLLARGRVLGYGE